MEGVQEPTSVTVQAPVHWVKNLFFNIISIMTVLVLMCCLGELVLRVLPLGKYKSAPFRQYDPQIGESLIPNTHVVHSRGCFEGEVSINRWGMRDRDRTLEKPSGAFRIAMIGDSAVEAVHVKPDQVVNIRMEQLLRHQGYHNIEVLSFGVGGIGTTQELLLYELKVRQFHPDLVLLMFSDNDVFNNSSTLQPKIYGIHDWYAPYYDLYPDGKLVFKPVERRYFNQLRSYIEAHSVLFYYLDRMWAQVELPLYKWQGLPLFYATYSESPNNEWMQAWQVTQRVLELTRDSVTADGAKLLVLPWPSATLIDPDWRQGMIKLYGHVPSSFNPYQAQQHLQQIADSGHIPLALITPYMQAYRDQHHLHWPYFSLTCDTHFSALGHQVSAEAIVQKLQELRLLPLPE